MTRGKARKLKFKERRTPEGSEKRKTVLNDASSQGDKFDISSPKHGGQGDGQLEGKEGGALSPGMRGKIENIS